MHWFKLCLTDICNVDLDLTLPSGQAFRWKFNEFAHLGDDWINVWTCVLGNHLILLKQKPISRTVDQKIIKCSPIYYSYFPFNDAKEHRIKIETLLVDYFQLHNQELNQYFNNSGKWKDPYLKRAVVALTGLRILRQDPVETVLGFICSSQNNIPRISQMMENLCRHYGTSIDCTSLKGENKFTLPQLKDLTGENVEKHLRELGFGYRAKFIVGTAKYIVANGGDSWLYRLRNVDYTSAQKALIELPGVGLKVADCICVYSLDKTEAVPVDTHILQLAQRYYAGKNQLPVIKSKTLTEKQYRILGDCLRSIWCPHAGYAQTFMFSADLRKTDLTSDTLDYPIEVAKSSKKRKSREECFERKEKSFSLKKERMS